MIDSIVVGDDVMVLGKVSAIVGNQVVIDIEGEAVMARPELIRRPLGGDFAVEGSRRKGREARRAGKSISEQPYSEDQRAEKYRAAWIQGWMEA